MIPSNLLFFFVFDISLNSAKNIQLFPSKGEDTKSRNAAFTRTKFWFYDSDGNSMPGAVTTNGDVVLGLHATEGTNYLENLMA